MLTIRKSCTRGRGSFGWLESLHTFSFGHHYDPANMGFSALRALNEDKLSAGEGFPSTAHRDVEIVTYVLAGALQVTDSLGTGGLLRAGDVQRASAGRGLSVCVRNASHTEGVHTVEMWLTPKHAAGCPSRQQRHFAPEHKRGRLCAIAAGDGRDGALPLDQDAAIYATLLDRGQEVIHTFAPARNGWVQLLRGQALVDGQLLAAGDGAALVGQARLSLRGAAAAELLVIDLQA